MKEISVVKQFMQVQKLDAARLSAKQYAFKVHPFGIVTADLQFPTRGAGRPSSTVIERFSVEFRMRLGWRGWSQLAVLLPLALGCIAQTPLALQQQSEYDFEEVHFEFNSSAVVDGIPSLLRLATLLRTHPRYKVHIEGNTDNLEPNPDKLGLFRAIAVRDFLIKFGGSSSQIEVVSRGRHNPELSNFKNQASSTDVARWVNRRVTLLVVDEAGRPVPANAGSFNPPAPAREANMTEDVLKRLDQLAEMQQATARQNQELQNQLSDVHEQISRVQNAQRVQPSSEIPANPMPLTDHQAENIQKGKTGKQYVSVQIYYATDRASTAAGKYGADRGDGALQLGICNMSVPIDLHTTGKVERPFSVAFRIVKYELKEDPERHIILYSAVPLSYAEFYDRRSERIAHSAKREAFVFVHRYNVTFVDAARRTAQLWYDLKFTGAPILYSWPSVGETTAYPVDSNNAAWSAEHLRWFLEDVRKKTQADTIHLIAHSMGNAVLTQALDTMARDRSAVRFNQVILAAPDVDVGRFEQLAHTIAATAKRMTLYASSFDDALLASKVFNGHPRAGDSGKDIVVVPPIETRDVSGVAHTVLGLNHSYFADTKSLLFDLFKIIHGRPT